MAGKEVPVNPNDMSVFASNPILSTGTGKMTFGQIFALLVSTVVIITMLDAAREVERDTWRAFFFSQVLPNHDEETIPLQPLSRSSSQTSVELTLPTPLPPSQTASIVSFNAEELPFQSLPWLGTSQLSLQLALSTPLPASRPASIASHDAGEEVSKLQSLPQLGSQSALQLALSTPLPASRPASIASHDAEGVMMQRGS
ncbi:hypothetical protein H0H92_002526 [Tricholoma furcatifolium]|nr:hypothetical protein H0H92_002526 [Tricholoma furcatifolium]